MDDPDNLGSVFCCHLYCNGEASVKIISIWTTLNFRVCDVHDNPIFKRLETHEQFNQRDG